MVVNELLLNAMEHGLAGRVRGTIRIHLDDLGDAVRLIIADDGHGLPPDFDPVQQAGSLGLQIVRTLVTDDLKGHLTMESIAPAEPPAEPIGSDCWHAGHCDLSKAHLNERLNLLRDSCRVTLDAARSTQHERFARKAGMGQNARLLGQT